MWERKGDRPSGTVNSPNYPANYNDNEYCTWQIQVPVNKKIRLDFTEFKTETAKDYLLIYDTNHYQSCFFFLEAILGY